MQYYQDYEIYCQMFQSFTRVFLKVTYIKVIKLITYYDNI
jgi:hypothetical protein